MSAAWGLVGATESGVCGRRGDNPPERCDVAGEAFPSQRCESRPHAATSLAERPLDRKVPGFLEGRQLFGQRRVGQPEFVTEKSEVGPVGHREHESRQDDE